MPELIDLTNTSLGYLRNCQEMFRLRFLEKLVPMETPDALIFGRHIHRALQILAKSGMGPAVDWLYDEYEKTAHTPKDTQSYANARVMVEEYFHQLRAADKMETVFQEKVFTIPVTNPETGGESKTFQLSGKVDEVFKDDAGNYWIREMKTAARIDQGYIERLWTEMQPRIYKFALEEALGIHIRGICFDLLQKPSIRMRAGETEAEFETRRDGLLAKSKTGKTMAQRQVGEELEEFIERLHAWYAEENRFHRELIILDDAEILEVKTEVWTAGQIFLEARRRGVWLKNRSHCFLYNRPCQYFQICRTGGSELVKTSFYRKEEPNPELREEE